MPYTSPGGSGSQSHLSIRVRAVEDDSVALFTALLLETEKIQIARQAHGVIRRRSYGVYQNGALLLLTGTNAAALDRKSYCDELFA